MRPGLAALLGAMGLWAATAAAREPGDPIALAWREGDVAGMTTIRSADGRTPVGFVEYHQTRDGDVLHSRRVAHFADGSSDEDEAVARVGAHLEALSGRSIVRDAHGAALVDLDIDVAGGRIVGTIGSDSPRRWDERVALPSGTYWGPLVFLVLKNFAANAEDGRVVFRTVAPTPAPRVFDLELVRLDRPAAVSRPGGTIPAERFALRPRIHWTVDPLLRLIAPSTEFLVQPGAPPALARFSGPRNYAGQEIVLE